ncbi:polysaccharide pyruvyl transferase CsaB [Acetonema longum]|uniref:Polysaccharide pyruvyl transferase CsaB n=1 Tax=Acetonema longum DSM 6540 TaxID=1009370 RepID=F7NNX9_9FIRM|nr:polysaccharide pyruvyl transferase CsaB [Acetonema longum]EGO62313.1 polysaccharide pyruvyl transferase CsaB [Acetonema longum DSM 6540]
MTKVVLSGYYGFTNSGDEAMLAAIIHDLRVIDPAVAVTVISGHPADTEDRHKVKAIYRLDMIEIVRAISRSDLLISGGGSLLQDVTSDRSLYYYLSIILLAKTLGKRVMLYGQGIGPLAGDLARRVTRHILNLTDLITVRDKGSLDELEALGVIRPAIELTADPVLSMEPADKAAGRTILEENGLMPGSPVVGFFVREWQDLDYYKQVLAVVADRLVTEYGVRILFVPMQQQDVAAAEKVAVLMQQPAVVMGQSCPVSQMLSLVGNLDMLIGIRLHALIFAAVMHVPLLGVSYDPKISRFLESLGEPSPPDLHTVSAENLLARIGKMWSVRKEINRARESCMAELRSKAFRNAQLAMQLARRQGRE